MKNILWKYEKPLADGRILEEIEKKYNFFIPEDLKQAIIKHNGGVPDLCRFDLGKEKEKVFGGFLSFFADAIDSFFEFVDLFVNESNDSLELFPFGLDPAGNFFCVDREKNIVFWFHEIEDCVIKICDSFSDFLELLY